MGLGVACADLCGGFFFLPVLAREPPYSHQRPLHHLFLLHPSNAIHISNTLCPIIHSRRRLFLAECPFLYLYDNGQEGPFTFPLDRAPTVLATVSAS